MISLLGAFLQINRKTTRIEFFLIIWRVYAINFLKTYFMAGASI